MSDVPAIKPPRKQQIRPGVEAALKLIVERGLSFSEAAQAVGYQAESLTKALKKPHVLARLSDLKRAWQEARTFKAWVGMAELADSAVSEEVRHKSLKVFLEASGELGGKSDAPPSVGTAIQIIIDSGSDRREVRISDGSKSGVIECEPWAPEPEPETGGDDD